MPSFDGDLVHFVGDRVISIPSQTANASPNHEMRSSFSSRAEQLIDVALAITDMNASSRIAKQLRGLPDIVQPCSAQVNGCRLLRLAGVVGEPTVETKIGIQPNTLLADE
ncbi:hypothetical protein ACVWZZ_004471 [Bradyrhizobium sp. LM6.10]